MHTRKRLPCAAEKVSLSTLPRQICRDGLDASRETKDARQKFDFVPQGGLRMQGTLIPLDPLIPEAAFFAASRRENAALGEFD